MLGDKLWRTHKELGEPKEQGEYRVPGLGAVWISHKFVDAAKERDFRVKYELVCVNEHPRGYKVIFIDDL